jgi:hypothetical protein
MLRISAFKWRRIDRSLLHPDLPLHLLMESSRRPSLLSREHILPRHRIVLSPQDILMHARRPSPERSRLPLSTPHDLELHPTTDGLSDTVRPAEGLHAERFLRRLPVLETRLEGVRRGGLVRGVGGGTDAVTESVVDAWGGGSGGSGVVGEGVDRGVGGNDAERLVLLDLMKGHVCSASLPS